jgi:hypothetical protein
MKSVNLIPAPRLVAKRRRVHLRRCAAGCAVWAVMSVIAAGATQAMWRTAADPQAEERLAIVADEIDRTDRAIAATRTQLAAAQSTLRAKEAIANQPDWGVLLAVLAQSIKQDVVLKNCHVHPAGRRPGEVRRPPAAVAPSASGAAAEAVPFVLDANGMAKDLEAAHRFVSDLEKTGLFARVTLLDTAREPFINGDAIAFRLECSLDEPAAGAPGAPVTPSDAAQASTEDR